MKTDIEDRLRERFGGLAPGLEVKERVVAGLQRERRAPRRSRLALYGALAAAACLLVIAALWHGGGDGGGNGGGSESPASHFSRLLLSAEGDAGAVALVLEDRLAARGYEGAEVRLAGPGGELEVWFPGDIPVEEVEALMVRPGTLEFRIVVEGPPGSGTPVGHRWVDRADGSGPLLVVEPEDSRDRFGGEDLDPLEVEAVVGGSLWMVRFAMMEDRKEAFADFSERNLDRYLAIIVDGLVESAPLIKARLEGGAMISGGGPGGFTREEAESLAAVLRSGPLPAEVRPRR